MKIGLDFGTSYTKVAYLNDQGEPELFRFDQPAMPSEVMPSELITTEVAYYDHQVFVGNDARLISSEHPTSTYANNIKRFLPFTNLDERHRLGWQLEQTPEQVTTNFLDYVVRSVRASFAERHNDIAGIVVAIPELWRQSATCVGADVLQNIVENGLDLPLLAVCGEPICAAAFFAHTYQQEHEAAGDRAMFHGNLLICDSGGGAFTAALCHLAGDQIVLLDSQWDKVNADGSGGMAFNQLLMGTARDGLQDAVARNNNNAEYLRAWHDFEKQKLAKHQTVVTRLQELQNEPDDIIRGYIAESVCYTVSQVKLNYDMVLKALSPLRDGINQVLSRIQVFAEKGNHKIDRLMIVGGSGQSPFVQQMILENLGISADNDIRFDRKYSADNCYKAVAAGAALLATDKIKALEYFPHSLGMLLCERRFLKEVELVEELYAIVRANKIAVCLKSTTWLQEEETWLPVEVLDQSSQRLRVVMQWNGNGPSSEITLETNSWPSPGWYFIGIEISISKAGTLIFRPTNGGPDWRCSIGMLDHSAIPNHMSAKESS